MLYRELSDFCEDIFRAEYHTNAYLGATYHLGVVEMSQVVNEINSTPISKTFKELVSQCEMEAFKCVCLITEDYLDLQSSADTTKISGFLFLFLSIVFIIVGSS